MYNLADNHFISTLTNIFSYIIIISTISCGIFCAYRVQCDVLLKKKCVGYKKILTFIYSSFVGLLAGLYIGFVVSCLCISLIPMLFHISLVEKKYSLKAIINGFIEFLKDIFKYQKKIE